MSQKQQTLLLGAHMSIAGGLYKAIERGESIGCTVIQIFTKSNRQWKAKELTLTDISQFKSALKNSSIQSVTVHASYLINLGSPNKETEQKSINALKKELERCHALGLTYLVLHPGSHLKTGEKECLDRISKNLNYIFENTPGQTMILLETMAGQGSSTCYAFEHIAHIYKKSFFKKRLGVCFDTCHAFVAGYDLTTEKSYTHTWKEFDRIIGLNLLKVIHINDSKKNLGSKVDRHENIGEGKIGENAFKFLFNDPRFFDIPKILETPKESPAEDKKNMDRIKNLISEKTRNQLNLKK